MCRSHPSSIISYLPDRFSPIFAQLPEPALNSLEEIRLRAISPLSIWTGGKSWFVTESGNMTDDPTSAATVTADDVIGCLNNMTSGSLYTVEEELRQGFMTIKGGHRVGVCGQVTLEGNKVRAFAHFHSVTIRIAHQIKGAADTIMPHIINPTSNTVCSTLIVSPPQAGKTTMLRDIARQISSPPYSFKTAIVDERSEIAGCYCGIPQLDVGTCTDVLDRAPKADGIMMLIRACSPDVIITDELGRTADISAIKEALNCGIAIITSIHGHNVKEVSDRPSTRELYKGNLFDQFIELSRRQGPGTIERIIDGGGTDNG